jgi:hypothetical protein
MRNPIHSTFAISFVLFALAGPALPVSAQNRDGGFQEQYGVLVENNIFRRDRTTPPAQATAPVPATEAAAPTPLQQVRLTGLVFEQGQYRAYFEDLTSGEIHRVVAGDTIAGGSVREISFDAVAFESNGQPRWIEIGHDLTGTVAGAGSASPAPAPEPATGTGVGPSPSLSGDERLRLIEEQMRNRARGSRGRGPQ